MLLPLAAASMDGSGLLLVASTMRTHLLQLLQVASLPSFQQPASASRALSKKKNLESIWLEPKWLRKSLVMNDILDGWMDGKARIRTRPTAATPYPKAGVIRKPPSGVRGGKLCADAYASRGRDLNRQGEEEERGVDPKGGGNHSPK